MIGPVDSCLDSVMKQCNFKWDVKINETTETTMDLVSFLKMPTSLCLGIKEEARCETSRQATW